jgi:DNA polymerase III sliding clamp (beta) subunit (PCNA family)
MQLTLSQSHLQRLTRGLTKIIPARGSAMPALDQVRFRRVGGNNAEATGTNLEETLTLALPGTATGDGGPDAFLCPIDELRRLAKDMSRGDAALLAALPGESPRLDIILQVSGRNIRSNIDAMPVAEFPETLVPAVGVPADVGTFLKAFRTVLPFASEDPTRALTNGVFWHEEARSLVATDGRRLSVLRLDGLSLGQDVILPPAKLLANGILEGAEGTVGIAMAGDRVHLDVTCGPWHYQARGLDGTYPNYQVVIPADVGQFVATVEIAAADLALVRSAIPRLMTESNGVVHLCTVPGGAPFLVSAIADAGGGRGHVELANSRCRTDAMQVQAVNGSYLLECLEAGFLTLRLPADLSPWLCTGERPGLHCLMPMNEQNQDVAAFVAGRLNSGETPMPRERQNAPAVSPPESTAPATPPAATAETAATTETPASGMPAEGPESGGAATVQLTMVPGDALQDLRNAVTEAESALRQATAVVRPLRDKVRAVERFLRDREKLYARSEKVIDQLKLVAGF